jgi:hypothetical protein
VARAPLLRHLRDQVRGVLQIRVHEQDGLAGRRLQAGGQRRLLAEVPAQMDRDDSRIPGGLPVEDFAAAVRGAVVDADDLEAELGLLDLVDHLVQTLAYDPALVEDGQDDGELTGRGHGRAA